MKNYHYEFHNERTVLKRIILFAIALLLTISASIYFKSTVTSLFPSGSGKIVMSHSLA